MWSSSTRPRRRIGRPHDRDAELEVLRRPAARCAGCGSGRPRCAPAGGDRAAWRRAGATTLAALASCPTRSRRAVAHRGDAGGWPVCGSPVSPRDDRTIADFVAGLRATAALRALDLEEAAVPRREPERTAPPVRRRRTRRSGTTRDPTVPPGPCGRRCWRCSHRLAAHRRAALAALVARAPVSPRVGSSWTRPGARSRPAAIPSTPSATAARALAGRRRGCPIAVSSAHCWRPSPPVRATRVSTSSRCGPSRSASDPITSRCPSSSSCAARGRRPPHSCGGWKRSVVWSMSVRCVSSARARLGDRVVLDGHCDAAHLPFAGSPRPWSGAGSAKRPGRGAIELPRRPPVRGTGDRGARPRS